MFRIEETLSHRRDCSHERTGIRALIFLMRLERDVLKHVRFHDDFVRVEFSQRHQRTRAAHDTACRHDDRCGETKFAQWINDFLVRRIPASRACLRRNFGNLIACTTLTDIRTLTGRTKKIHATRSE